MSETQRNRMMGREASDYSHFAEIARLYPTMQADLLRLAESIDGERAGRLTAEFGARPLAVLLGVAFPPLTPYAGWQADAVDRIASLGWRSGRRRAELFEALHGAFDAERGNG